MSICFFHKASRWYRLSRAERSYHLWSRTHHFIIPGPSTQEYQTAFLFFIPKPGTVRLHTWGAYYIICIEISSPCALLLRLLLLLIPTSSSLSYRTAIVHTTHGHDGPLYDRLYRTQHTIFLPGPARFRRLYTFFSAHAGTRKVSSMG